MKVFNVLLLVSVVEAVHSHGRTESESTIYNKTQAYKSETTIFNKTLPHESLNNLTYDFSYLVMQWPTSFCSANGTACIGNRFPTISLCTACDHRIILLTDLKVLTAQTHPSDNIHSSILDY